MILSLLYVHIILAIRNYESYVEQSESISTKSTTSTPPGNFHVTCMCDSIVSNVCGNYTCKIPDMTFDYSCFPGRSQVTLPNGRLKQLSQLRIGDLVMVNQKHAYEPILTFIHVNKQQLFSYLAMDIYSTLSNTSSTLFVSSNHLIFDYDSGEARFAGKFRVGDRLQFIQNNRITLGEIKNIELRQEQGYYAPLTPSGTIVIDGIVASNYASVSNHALAHRAMGLYRWWIKWMGSTVSEDIPWMLHGMLYVEQIARWCGLNT